MKADNYEKINFRYSTNDRLNSKLNTNSTELNYRRKIIHTVNLVLSIYITDHL